MALNNEFKVKNDLNTLGKILSGGTDLATIFSPSNTSWTLSANNGTFGVAGGDTVQLQGGNGVDVRVASGTDTLSISGIDATTSGKGVASFHADNFAVTNGVVTVKNGGIVNDELAGSIADNKLNTISTTGKVANSATTATLSNTVNAIVARGASGEFSSGSITVTGNLSASGTVTGNAVVASNITATNLLSAANTFTRVLSVGDVQVRTVGTSNVFLGNAATGNNAATGSDNFVFGVSAGNALTSGHSNIFMGRYAGCVNTTGIFNNFLGNGAGKLNTTGSCNNFFGNAGLNNITGQANNFMGFLAGSHNTTGDYNNFVGSQAGRANTTGYFNTFLGNRAGISNTTGSYNNFLGSNAGISNTTGTNNNFVGRGAGLTNTTGSNNTIIGSEADVATNSLSGVIVLGTGAVATESNQIVLSTATASFRNIGNTFQIGTSSLTDNLTVFGAVSSTGIVNTNAGFRVSNAATSGHVLRGNGTNFVSSTIQVSDVPTLNQNTTGSAATLAAGRTIAITGDLAYTSPTFNGSTNVTAAGTLATVNSNVGAFTNASVTVNAKGLVTAASSGTAPVTTVTGTSPVVSSGGTTPAISLASGYGDTQNPYASKTQKTFLAAPNTADGVPTFRTIQVSDVPTLNQTTTGSAATITTTRTLWGQNFNGSQNVAGNLTSVGNITGTAGITIQTGAAGNNLSLVATGTGNIVLTPGSSGGSVTGITKAMVGLSNADNTTDAAKPVSTAQQTALNLKANLASPSFTGTVSGITKAMVGLANADNTTDAAKPVSTAQQTALNLKANLASPTFTGTVAGITKAMVGLANADNTSDAAKPVSTAQQTALNLKANLNAPTFTGTVIIPTADINGGTIDGTTIGASVAAAASFTSLNASGNVNISGNLTVSGSATQISTTNLIIKDPLIFLGEGNASDTVDIGFTGAYNHDGIGVPRHTGLVRDDVTKTWTLFSNLSAEILSAVHVPFNDPSIVIDTLKANIVGNLTGTASQIADGSVSTNKIVNDAVTYAKIQNVSQGNRILGRQLLSSGAGDVQEIACTDAGFALLDDASSSAQRDTLGVGSAQSVTFGEVIVNNGVKSVSNDVYNATTATNVATLSTFANASYNSAKFTVQIKNTNTNARCALEIIATKNNTTWEGTVYGIVDPANLFTNVDITAGSTVQLSFVLNGVAPYTIVAYAQAISD